MCSRRLPILLLKLASNGTSNEFGSVHISEESRWVGLDLTETESCAGVGCILKKDADGQSELVGQSFFNVVL